MANLNNKKKQMKFFDSDLKLDAGIEFSRFIVIESLQEIPLAILSEFFI